MFAIISFAIFALLCAACLFLFMRTALKDTVNHIEESKHNLFNKHKYLGKGIIVCVFPGCGKAKTLHGKGHRITDCDIARYIWIHCGEVKFRNPSFPQNYLNRILEAKIDSDIVCISASMEIRKQLDAVGATYWIVIPKPECKEEWLQRLKDSNCSEKFINNIDNHWDHYLDDCRLSENHKNVRVIELSEGEHLSDVIDVLLYE